MLERLTVRNLVVIRDAELELVPGLNVVTGETGAGKTILTQALGLVLGDRAGGADGAETYVEAIFAIDRETLARPAFDGVRELVDEPAEELILARRVSADGRSRALVCGRSATRGALEAAGAELVGIVSQHEARALTRPAVQRALLDGFLGAAHVPLLEAMRIANRVLGEAERALAAAEADAADADRLTADLEALVAGVDSLEPRPGEPDELRRERERLRHADTLLQAAAGAAALLNPDDGDGAVALAERADRELAAAEAHDPVLATLGADVRDAAIRLGEAAHALHAYTASVEHDPVRLDAVEERLARLDALARRHGSLEAALSAAAAARERLERLGRRDQELAALATEQGVALAAAGRAAVALSTARRRGATELGREVERQLADLGMAEARLRVEVVPRPLGPSGADEVRLLVQTNPGVPAGPVASTASGGELSRIALAIRVAAHEREGGRVLVFDEIDTGVGGRTAVAVGEKLAELAVRGQVICVTHLAAIAARADRHFRVVKEAADETVTRIEQLEGDAVDEELARMLGGDEGSLEARTLARSLRRG